MSDYEKLRGDHLLLMVMARDLSRLSSQNDPPCRIELFRARTKLASSLIRHLKEEDWVVYPALLRSHVQSRREAARTLQLQTGSLANAFNEYMRRWTTFTIERDWQGYREETSALLNLLTQRITREDTNLYGAAANDKVLVELPNRAGK